MNKLYDKSSVLAALIWKFFESIGVYAIQFIVSTIIARKLLPEMYGIIALVSSFIAVLQVFVQSGLNTALIQKKEVDNLDYSTVFLLNVLISIVLYVGLFFAAPAVGDYYGMNIISKVIRVLGLNLVFGSLTVVQIAYISRNLMFKELFKRSILSILVSGIVGIGAAYSGLGIWSLVLQQITLQLSSLAILWLTVQWRPSLAFSLQRAKTLYSFGSKLLISSLINTVYNNIRSLIIGKIYSPADLGLYSKGEQFPNFITEGINGAIQAVMLPTLAASQDDISRVKAILRRTIITSSFAVFPVLVGLAATAGPLVRLLLTDRWEAVVPFIQIFAFSYLLMPIHTSNLQAINALGRSDIFLKLEIVKKTIGIIVLVITVPLGVEAIAIGSVVTSLVFSFINTYPNNKLLQYGYREQLKDIAPTLITSIIMGVIVYSLRLLSINDFALIVIQIAVGIVVYLLMAVKFQRDTLHFILDLIRTRE